MKVFPDIVSRTDTPSPGTLIGIRSGSRVVIGLVVEASEPGRTPRFLALHGHDTAPQPRLLYSISDTRRIEYPGAAAVFDPGDMRCGSNGPASGALVFVDGGLFVQFVAQEGFEIGFSLVNGEHYNHLESYRGFWVERWRVVSPGPDGSPITLCEVDVGAKPSSP